MSPSEIPAIEVHIKAHKTRLALAMLLKKALGSKVSRRAWSILKPVELTIANRPREAMRCPWQKT